MVLYHSFYLKESGDLYMSNKAGGNILFHDSVTTTGNGNVFKVNDITTLNVIFSISTSGSFSVTFEGQVQYQGSWFPIKTVNLSTLTLSTTATDATGVYQIDTTGFENIRVRVTAISGTLSCYGKGVY